MSEVSKDSQDSQDRYRSLVTAARTAGAQPAGLITPTAVLRFAVVYNLAIPSALGVGVKNGKPVIMGSYPVGDEGETMDALKGGSKSVAKWRAARALAVGFTPQDVDDLAFIAESKGASKSKDALMAWIGQYRKMDAAATVEPQDAS